MTLVAGDINVHLEKRLDADSHRFHQIIEGFNMKQFVSEPTHDLGGLLDVVIASADCALEDVTVGESGLSDHKLIHWSMPVTSSNPEYMTISRRNWRNFDHDQFIMKLKGSSLCSPADAAMSATELADRYHSVITCILDDLAPVKSSKLRTRLCRPFYDADCRQARRVARRLERVYLKNRGTDRESDAFNSWRTALKASRRLVRCKGRKYWNRTLQDGKQDTKRMWSNLDKLLGKEDSSSKACLEFSADDFHRHIDDKIDNIRNKTSSAVPVTFTHYSGPDLLEFIDPTTEEVIELVRSSSNKYCLLDPLPTWLLKDSIDVLAPFLRTLMTASLNSGEFPLSWKRAIVIPHLKRPGLEQNDVVNYRPVSNLPFLSKLLEKFVNKQLVAHLVKNDLMPKNQSAYRKGHSTETAILRIYNDIVDAIANGRVAVLCLLDLSAAFDTVDHATLIRRLEISYGLKGQVLSWLRDYVTGRMQSVRCNGQTSSYSNVLSGVPQGSVLGPLLFILYVADVGRIIKAFGLDSHSYADDSQIYSFCLPADSDRLRSRIIECIAEVKSWMSSNRLSLNSGKTEFLWLSSPRRRSQINRTPFEIEDTVIAPSTTVRLLGVIFDETLSFTDHISNVTRVCYYHLRRIRSIRRYIPMDAAIQLIRALVLSRVDQCNGVLLGLPESQLSRLQSVLNASSRLIFGARWNDHVTPLLRDKLHWLGVRERITYKRCLITYRALNDTTCPDYISTLVCRATTNDRRAELRSSSRTLLIVPPPSKTAVFGDRSVTRGNPALWNSLPSDVINAKSVGCFEKLLKTHLFNISYK